MGDGVFGIGFPVYTRMPLRDLGRMVSAVGIEPTTY
jgi:hypothetical protein